MLILSYLEKKVCIGCFEFEYEDDNNDKVKMFYLFKITMHIFTLLFATYLLWYKDEISFFLNYWNDCIATNLMHV